MNDNSNNNERPRVYVNDRRRRTDWVTHMATIMSIIAWLVAFGVWIVLAQAQPESEHIFTRMFGAAVRTEWDESLLPIAFALLVLALCICVLAFFFNMLRKRRKTDKYKKSVIIIGVITIVGLVLFIFRFREFFMWWQ